MSDATIVALYDHYDDASKAVSDIVATGVPQDRISLLANNLSGDHPALVSDDRHAVDHHHYVRHYFHPGSANFALRAG